MGVKRVLRLHFPGRDKPVSEPIEQTARQNGTDIAGARALIERWVRDGDLRERADGGYDVIRWRGRTGG